MTATANNLPNATAAQLSIYETFSTMLGERLLKAEISDGALKIHYRTRSGYYFITVIFSDEGSMTRKQYFKNWNEDRSEPFNLITENNF